MKTNYSLLALLLVAPAYSADIAISGLPDATALAGTEVAPVVQGGETRKATAAQISTFVLGSSVTVGQVLRVTGSNIYGWGALDLADSDAITGDLPDANLSANVPLLNASTNTWTGTGNQQFAGRIRSIISGGGSNASIAVAVADPAYGWSETDQTTDEKNWDATLSNGDWLLRTVNDANNSARTQLQLTRGTGLAVTGITYSNSTDNAVHTFHGSLAGILVNGTYTPTLTNVANLDGSTSAQWQYNRVGATVNFSGQVSINPTATLTATQLGISLPVASNFTAATNLAGTCAAATVSDNPMALRADTTNDRAELAYVAVDTTDHAVYCHGTYVLQ